MKSRNKSIFLFLLLLAGCLPPPDKQNNDVAVPPQSYHPNPFPQNVLLYQLVQHFGEGVGSTIYQEGISEEEWRLVNQCYGRCGCKISGWRGLGWYKTPEKGNEKDFWLKTCQKNFGTSVGLRLYQSGFSEEEYNQTIEILKKYRFDIVERE